MDLTNKQLDEKFGTACQDIRNTLQEVSLKIDKIISRLNKIEEKLKGGKEDGQRKDKEKI